MQQRFGQNNSSVIMFWIALSIVAMMPAAAQTNSGAITGVIQDAQGAVIANARITLINTEQGAGSARECPSIKSSEGPSGISRVPGQPRPWRVAREGQDRSLHSRLAARDSPRQSPIQPPGRGTGRR